jgi:restriction system protein
MFSASVFTSLLAAVLLVAAASWLLGRRRTARHDNAVDDPTSSALAQLPWPEFRAVVCEYFRRREFAVTDRAGGTSQDGSDLVLTRRDEYYLVQCKRWHSPLVDVDSVRELCLSMAARHAAGGFIVTSGAFTTAAREFAAGRDVELVDGERLRTMFARPQRRGTFARV